ncbi:NifB/NifX family molybdenum-iron cluster-binding protein [Anaeroselena agilis]|uniref:NifB/NifX family molybdenum-iron cluster-binding protein n=1 Tax=Anaeroselena agilis TaxID=3063788 RepID=A0ABU3NT42_9FIRM|nr:NifB/NifX family molybdenum-iron cluster-binding protein [Selenomonadales bacterium 4137-cl]
MKVVVTAGGPGLEERFDTRFGRAAYFIVCDLENDSWESHPNTQNLEAAQGAGIQAAQSVQRLGASALITGHVGPKAFKVLDANAVKIFSATAQTVGEALSAYKNGLLSQMAAPDVEGHWV